VCIILYYSPCFICVCKLLRWQMSDIVLYSALLYTCWWTHLRLFYSARPGTPSRIIINSRAYLRLFLTCSRQIFYLISGDLMASCLSLSHPLLSTFTTLNYTHAKTPQPINKVLCRLGVFALKKIDIKIYWLKTHKLRWLKRNRKN